MNRDRMGLALVGSGLALLALLSASGPWAEAAAYALSLGAVGTGAYRLLKEALTSR